RGHPQGAGGVPLQQDQGGGEAGHYVPGAAVQTEEAGDRLSDGAALAEPSGALMQVAHRYFKALYQRTMHQAYAYAYKEIESTPGDPLRLLECGAGSAVVRERLA